MAQPRIEISRVNLPSPFARKLIQVKNPNHLKHNNIVLALDPGYTTGIAVIHGDRLIMYGQMNTRKLDLLTYKDIERILDEYLSLWDINTDIHTMCKFEMVVEDYRIYSWKSEEHEWSDVYVARLIGFIQAMCVQRSIEFRLRLAQQAKGFVTDEKLKKMGWYQRGLPHARDAIRHALYHTLFDNKYIGKDK